MNIISDKVKPVHLEKYMDALVELKAVTFPGYKDLTIKLLNARGFVVTDSQIKNTVTSVNKSWIILNAMRAVVGLPEIEETKTPGELEIAKSLKLQKAS